MICSTLTPFSLSSFLVSFFGLPRFSGGEAEVLFVGRLFGFGGSFSISDSEDDEEELECLILFGDLLGLTVTLRSHLASAGGWGKFLDRKYYIIHCNTL